MAICEISNGKIIVSVDSQGAELKSLRRVDTEREYIWCGDSKYWSGVSPILFPFIGKLKNEEYRFGDKTYQMTKHGFARDMEFQLVSHDATEIWFSLDADEETKKIYPFDFKLSIGYRLEDLKVKVLWRVENPSDETIYFSIGGHPAINCPINPEDDRDQYFLQFDAECIRCTEIGNDGLTNGNKTIYELEDGLLPITESLFLKDAIIMEDHQVHSISMLTPDKKPYIKAEFDTPIIAVWTPAGKKAPFICIEPWCGLCDSADFKGTLQERKWGNQVELGKRFASGYSIEIV